MTGTLKEKICDAINFALVWQTEDAIDPIAEIFDNVVAALKRDPRFKNIPCSELDLLLADVRRRAEQDIGLLLHDMIDVNDAVRDITEGLES
jgi:hypothetical protein